jgi:WD40 repeat protein
MIIKNLTAAFLCSSLLFVNALSQDKTHEATLIVQTGFSAYISALALSADGKVIAGGSWDKTVQLWDITSRKQIHSFTGHSFWVSALSFTSDNKLLVSCGDNKVKAWDVSTLTEAFSFEVKDEDVDALAISSDGQLIVGAGSNGHVWLWDAKARKLLRTIKTRSAAVKAVAFSPDGKSFASGGIGGTVEFWSAPTGEPLTVLDDDSRRELRAVAFNREGTMLATGSEGKHYLASLPKINLWDIGARKLVHTLDGHTDTINSVTFTRDGKRLASGSDDMSIRIWDAFNGTEIQKLDGHFGAVTEVALDPTQQQLVSGSGDMTIKIWDLVSGTEIATLAGHSSGINAVALSSNGKLLASGANGIIRLGQGVTNTIKVWDASAGRLSATFKNQEHMVTSIAFDPHGRWLATADSNAQIFIWNMRSGALERTLTLNEVSTGSDVTVVAFSPDGETLAAAGEDRVIKLWRVQTGKQQRVLHGHGAQINALTFSPDGGQLASGSGGITGSAPADDTAKIWSLRTGQLLHTLKGHKNPVLAVAYSPDGVTLATGSGDATIKLWNARSARLRQTIKNVSAVPGIQETAAVEALIFAPGGKNLISGGDDGSIDFWNVNTGALIKSRPGHVADVKSFALDPDRQLLVSGSSDGLIKFWSLSTYDLLCSISSLDDDGWAVVGPEGHFDTNKLENPEGIHWRMPSSPTSPLPLEIFMRDYYEPRLLPRLLEREPVPSVRDLTSLNRAQPAVKVVGVSPSNDNGAIQVTVEACGTTSDAQYDASGRPLRSGVYDLRLFRDGQLVGYTTRGKTNAPPAVQFDNSIDVTALENWRKENSVPLTDNCFTQPFPVQLQRLQSLPEVEFTAYAFNADRVKSSAATLKYKPVKPLNLVKRRAYIITVGVNAYEDPDWDLSYAARDAQVTEELLAQKLTATGIYEIVPLRLTSEYEVINNQKTPTKILATKQNFQTVLELLAYGSGKVDSSLIGQIPGADKLRKVEPEDLVIISFSSHGYTDKRGRFYLVPYDTGGKIKFTPSGQEIAPESLAYFISSDDLSAWVRDIDAGELVMIVDTCHSAGAIEEPGFKPGPMGSRGMGQLAYDKGMRVLAASQADDVALEVGKLQQGLLTYALMQEGLLQGRADKNKDGKTTLDEWLGYGVERVPAIYEDLKAGRVVALKNKDLRLTAVQIGPSIKKNAFQQPQLFDFKRKKYEIVVSAVAR